MKAMAAEVGDIYRACRRRPSICPGALPSLKWGTPQMWLRSVTKQNHTYVIKVDAANYISSFTTAYLIFTLFSWSFEFLLATERPRRRNKDVHSMKNTVKDVAGYFNDNCACTFVSFCFIAQVALVLCIFCSLSLTLCRIAGQESCPGRHLCFF